MASHLRDVHAVVAREADEDGRGDRLEDAELVPPLRDVPGEAREHERDAEHRLRGEHDAAGEDDDRGGSRGYYTDAVGAGSKIELRLVSNCICYIVL